MATPDTLGAGTLGDWLAETVPLLEAAGIATARLDARLIAGHVCLVGAAELIGARERELAESERGRLDALRARRLAREPVSRLLGRRAFMDLTLEVTPATLDPRPDTETLVEAALSLLHEDGLAQAPLTVLDLGTGTGAILIALLRALPRSHGLGIDVSPAALEVAARNADRAGVADRATFRQGDWLVGLDGPFDLIVANPPYIPTADLADLAPEVRDFDPLPALDGGADGLAAYRAIAADLPRVSADDAWWFCEVGIGQADAVAALLDVAAGTPASGRVFTDLAGIPRCVARKARMSRGRLEK